MTTNCKIGPVLLPIVQINDNNDQGSGDGNEKFDVVCSPTDAIRIQGLQTDVIQDTDNGKNILTQTGIGWGLLPIDASVPLTDNDFLNHRGYGIITDVTFDELNPLQTQVHIGFVQIAGNLNEYLSMDYTSGIGDGTVLASNYPNLVQNFIINDTMDTFDTTNTWANPINVGMASGSSIVSSGGNLVYTGASAINGNWGSTAIQTKNPQYAFGRSFEFDLQWVAKPATGHHDHVIYFKLSPNKDTTYWNWNNCLAINFNVSASYVSIGLYLISATGVWTCLNYWVTTCIDAKYRIDIDPSGYVTISINQSFDGVTWSGWTAIDNRIPTSINWNAVYASFALMNSDSTVASVRSSYFQLYYYSGATPVNIVALPPGTIDSRNGTSFTRTGADGVLTCYANPTGVLRYQTTIDNFYLGSVKAFNSNNASFTPNISTNTEDEILLPGQFNFHNGLVKCEFTNAGTVIVYYWNSGWVVLTTITLGTISLLKALVITPTKVTIQANETKWTLEIGKPFVRVEHSTTDLPMTLKGFSDHDGTVGTVLTSNMSVSMQTISYATFYNNGDTFRLMIMKLNPVNIYSDKIPADNETGIGWYNTSASGYNTASSIALEFETQTKQAIRLKPI